MPQPKKKAQPAREEPSNIDALRDLLGKGVLLTGEGLKEAVDEAVRRGRMTRRDAEDLVASLLALGRRQAQDAMNELEGIARKAPGSDMAMANVDRARRVAGVGSAFPISAYDDLTAAQVTDRLPDLTPPELRKVRDHERRNANRKSVLAAVDRLLG